MEGEYNTNKEERKRVRQLRVEARNASGDNEASNKRGKEAAEESSRSKGQQQIANSLTHLDKKKGGGIENITQIRVAADWREARRRVAEEQQRQDRLQRLQEEAVRSGQQNAAVEMRWAELLDQNMPQELHDDIEAQKSACSEIVASKDALIREFQLQLKLKDEEYVKALKQQADDVEELLRRMRLEFKELHEEYEVELEAIEDAFLTERDDVLQANKAAVDSLFEQRREMELQYMDRKRAREEAYQTEIEDLLVKDAEEYNKLKIKLETDIQALEQQLEEMRATYQLNTEKLEYNYRVLTERDNENSNTLAQLKRKQNKLKEVLSGIVAKYQETDSRDRKKNDELTEEYRRITKQYRDLQAKFRHFELSDQQRFDKIWRMHEDEAGDLVAKVLQADEIIQRQQLGWDWRAPDLAKIRDPQQPEESPAVVVAASDGDESRAATVPGDKLKAMLELLASEAGFLVEGKVREALDKLSPEEAELAQAESMLRALGVQDEADVAALVGHFFTEADADDEDESASAAGTALRDLGRVIKPDDVVRAIRRFVDERRARGGAAKTRLAAEASGAGGGGDAGGRSAAALLEERDFWHRLSGVVSQDTSEVWSSLEKHLQQYNQILHDRAGAIRDCASLNDQNLQLKELLNQYLHAKVNDDLIIRPADTIQLPLK
ncbi:sperm tail-domain-containing protein [Pelagophyceae sp. CCMP2097]|nr:sperm tail-domain-containing protein [Pelagophyceae sp. CCMP2097]